MTLNFARGFIAFSVVFLHVSFAIGAAVYLRFYITDQLVYLSTIATLAPVFGIYVAFLLDYMRPDRPRSRKKISRWFFAIICLLIVAYSVSLVLLLAGFGIGFIASENALPFALLLVEAFFGTSLMTCMRTLYKDG